MGKRSELGGPRLALSNEEPLGELFGARVELDLLSPSVKPYGEDLEIEEAQPILSKRRISLRRVWSSRGVGVTLSKDKALCGGARSSKELGQLSPNEESHWEEFGAR